MKQQWDRYISVPQNFSSENFAAPDGFYGPVYSWVWNAPVDEETVRRQIDEMTEAGIRAFYIIPEPPEFRPETMITTLSPAYLSPEYFQYIRLAVEYGQEKGMYVWLYDEGGWPSGNACGLLVKRRPDLAGKRLALRTVTLAAGEPYVSGEYAVAAFLDRTRISDGTSFPAETQIREYYRDIRKQGSNPVLPDLLEPETIPLFIELTHERYAAALGELAEAVVPCVFIDEPQTPMPAFPWDFPDLFRQEYSYEIEDYVYALLENENLSREAAQARQHYADLIAKLHVERFMTPIQAWCREHNLIFTGHLDKDHAMDQFRCLYGNPMPLLRKLDMPGIDVIWRQIYPGDRPVPEGESFFPRLAASAASQTGHLLTLSESFGVYGQNLSPETMRWVCNYQFVRGIQIMNPMIIPYGRKEWLAYGERPYFCNEMPGYSHLTQWNRHMNRISYFMSCGLPASDHALYLPTESLWKGKEEADAALRAYHNLGEELEAAGISFDIIDREAFLQGDIKDGALRVGHAVYHKIHIPDGVIPAKEVAERLEQLDGKCSAFAESSHPALKLCTRIAENGEHYVMVFCQSTEPVAGTVTLRTGAGCYQADAATGKLYLLAAASGDKQEITLRLLPGEEMLMVITDRCLPCSERKPVSSKREAKLLSCYKNTELILNSQGMTRDETAQQLSPDRDFASMVGENFSGEIVYTLSVELSESDLNGTLVLSLDRLEHSAEVSVNGLHAGFFSLQPYRLELDPALFHPGENRLELTVANTASNAYGSVDPHDWFTSAHIGPYNDREQAMERERKDGGLYGPVVLEIY